MAENWLVPSAKQNRACARDGQLSGGASRPALSADWIKVKNPNAPPVTRLIEE
jgi:hypothetical protein